MIFLGAILLIGFVMPIIMVHPFTQQRGLLFFNMSLKDTPFLGIVLLLAPGVAGISLLVLQGVAKHPVRGIAIVSLAVLPILLALIDLQIIGFLGPIGEFAQTEAAFHMLVFFLGLIVAPMVLLAGIRSRGYRPESTLAYWFGVSGAAVWFIFLIIPILPSEAGHIFLMFPIRLMSHTGVSGGPMGVLIMTACMSISALICIINKPTAEIKNVRKQTNLAFRVLLAGFLVAVLCAFTQFIRSFPAFMLNIKFICWFGGMFLLLPTGITDLIVGRSGHHGHQAGEHENSYTEPPDIPKRTG